MDKTIFFTYVLCIIFALVTFSEGYFESCDNIINLAVGEERTIASPNWPLHYNPGSSCRYNLSAPSGYQVELTCYYFLQLTNFECGTEFLLISSDDDGTFTESEKFCGYSHVVRSSTFSTMALGYISNSTIKSGSFKCYLRTVEQACDCGWTISQKIVGGTNAKPNQYPSMAGLFDLTINLVFCGAAIINYRYALTAAHCFSFNNNVNELAIVVGEQDTAMPSETRYTKTYTLSKIIIHESYDKITNLNDIALVQTNIDIIYHRGVGPACLPINNAVSSFAGDKVEVPGWGSTEFGGPRSDILQTVTLDVITNSVCKTTYPTLAATQLCTFTTGKDSCQFDSGGSLYYNPGRYYTVGIISYGTGCAGSLPAVNTRVTSYLYWIYGNTNANYCVK